jgi:hypothetical protein
VVSTVNASCVSSTPSNDADALSSTVCTPPALSGSSAMPGTCRLEVR